MRPFRILALLPELAWKSGQIRRRLRLKGRPAGDNDLLVAATALHHGIPLITRNGAHFANIVGLRVIDYSIACAPRR